MVVFFLPKWIASHPSGNWVGLVYSKSADQNQSVLTTTPNYRPNIQWQMTYGTRQHHHDISPPPKKKTYTAFCIHIPNSGL